MDYCPVISPGAACRYLADTEVVQVGGSDRGAMRSSLVERETRKAPGGEEPADVIRFDGDGSSGEIAAPPLTLRLFGQFEAQVQGLPLPRLRTRKGEWLLALLVLRAFSDRGRPRALDRAWLAGTLWPDSPEPLAFRSLRTALADLRCALGSEASRIHAPTPRTLSLALDGADVDLVAFDAGVASGNTTSLEAAIALYGGPLLEGWNEPWV